MPSVQSVGPKPALDVVVSALGHHWRLMCRCDDVCTWSRHVVVAPKADAKAELLVILRAHGDTALHGPRIEGIAIGVNGGVTVLVLRHPERNIP